MQRPWGERHCGRVRLKSIIEVGAQKPSLPKVFSMYYSKMYGDTRRATQDRIGGMKN